MGIRAQLLVRRLNKKTTFYENESFKILRVTTADEPQLRKYSIKRPQKLHTMKNALRPNYILSVLIFLFCWSNVSIAEDFYWINGSGNWNDGSHWSNTSGGPSIGSVPGSTDNVIFE